MNNRYKKILRITIILIMCIICCFFIGKKHDFLYNNYQKDFLFIYNEVKTLYPFENNEHKDNILALKGEIIRALNNCDNDDEFVNIVNHNFLDELNSTHTEVLNRSDSYKILKLYEGIYNNEYITDKNEKQFLKSLIAQMSTERFNEKYIDFIESGINQNAYYNVANESNLESQDVIENRVKYLKINSLLGANMVCDKPSIMNLLNDIKKYKVLIIDLRGNTGGNSAYFTDMFLPNIIDKNTSLEYYIALKNGITDEPNRRLIYNVYEDRIKEFTETSIKNDFKNYEFNSLVNDYKYFMPICENIERNPNSIDFKGNIYVIIDQDTCSSAGYSAYFMQQTGLCKVVGQESDDEILGMDPLTILLPESQLVLRLEYALPFVTELPFGKKIVVNPDIEVDLNHDMKANDLKEDSCISKILSIENILD